MPERKSWKGHEGAVLRESGGFEVIQCEPCGFAHIIPIPSPEELREVYRDEYYSTEKPCYFQRYREDLDWWNSTYGRRYDKFEEILAPERRKVLDVGSGPGIFLKHGQERGWEAVGIEPSRQAARYSREMGLSIFEDFLDESTAGALGKFDVVHMSQVLEHIPDPSGMLDLSGSLLLPGGLLCIVVPNDFNPFQRILEQACGFSPWWVAPPHHINYFTHDSMGRLLAKKGFDILSGTTTFPMEMFLLMGDDYVGNDRLGRECHQRRKNFERNMEKAGEAGLMGRLYSALADLGLGREVEIVARKR